MQTIEEYLHTISDLNNQMKLREILDWLRNEFPQLKAEIKWNQPFFTDHSTFIIAFSTAKKHFSFAPEQKTITKFKTKITEAGYHHTKNIVKILWDDEINYQLLSEIITYNIEDKSSYFGFFRKV